GSIRAHARRSRIHTPAKLHSDGTSGPCHVNPGVEDLRVGWAGACVTLERADLASAAVQYNNAASVASHIVTCRGFSTALASPPPSTSSGSHCTAPKAARTALACPRRAERGLFTPSRTSATIASISSASS